MGTWVVTFVLYLFVKPDNSIPAGSNPTLNSVPVAVNPAVSNP
ncbi:hypothetical protein ACLMAJ_23860 [Nocardia sp. KC 131]